MASSTRCCKNIPLDAWLRHLVAGLLLACVALAQAQTLASMNNFRTERVDDEVLLSVQLSFDLSPAVEDALLKGVPIFFVAETEIYRERWYWFDKRVHTAVRQVRLAYLPLTRRWRVNVSSAIGRDGTAGLTLNQSFEDLLQALNAVKKIARWKIADSADLDPTLKYRVEFRFRLDVGQLPRPFQIGTLGQSDWDMTLVANAPLSLEPSK